MADTKLSALTTPSGGPAAADLLYLVDVSDTTDDAAGSSRKTLLSDVIALAPQPAGSGSEVQYRASSTTFGAVANVTRSANGNLTLTSQTTPGSLSDGELYYGTQKTISAYLNGGVKHHLVACIYSSTADATVGNTTTETSLVGTGVGSLTLPANFLIAGKTLRITACGYYSSKASSPGNLQINIKLGSTVVNQLPGSGGSALAGSAASFGWRLSALVTCRSTGASGSVSSGGDMTRLTSSSGANADFGFTKNTGPVTIDTTAGQTLDLTATFNIADVANTITCTNLTVEILN